MYSITNRLYPIMKQDQDNNEDKVYSEKVMAKMDKWNEVMKDKTEDAVDVVNAIPEKIGKEMLEVDRDVREYLRKIAYQNRWYNVIWTSILRGLFTAIGATIVFAIVIFVLSKIFSSTGDIPLIGDWLTDTHIEDFLPGD